MPNWFSDYWQPSVLLKEKLYFIVSLSYPIIRFDTKTEKFSEIAAPCFGNLSTWWLNLMVISGCIHLCVRYGIRNVNSSGFCLAIHMWRMGGDGDWRKVVITVWPLESFPSYQQPPLHVMKNGNWVVHSNGKGCVYEVDLEKHTKDELCSYTGMHVLAGGKYIETFVSLNRYI